MVLSGVPQKKSPVTPPGIDPTALPQASVVVVVVVEVIIIIIVIIIKEHFLLF